MTSFAFEYEPGSSHSPRPMGAPAEHDPFIQPPARFRSGSDARLKQASALLRSPRLPARCHEGIAPRHCDSSQRAGQACANGILSTPQFVVPSLPDFGLFVNSFAGDSWDPWLVLKGANACKASLCELLVLRFSGGLLWLCMAAFCRGREGSSESCCRKRRLFQKSSERAPGAFVPRGLRDGQLGWWLVWGL